MNKKTLLQGFFSLVLLFLISCNKQDDVNSISIEENAKVVIDPSSQINLKETVLSSEEIKEVSCGEAKEVTLFAGQHIDVGTLTVSNDDDYLYVCYEVKGDWLLSETHLFVGEEQDLPLNGGNNPKIGHFPYHGNHGLVSSYTFTINLASLSSCFVIAAHAAVIESVDGEISSSETAFAYGENEFSGNRWGWYLDYCQTTCETSCPDSFAKNDGSVGSSACFLEDGFTNWGWTNSFNYYDLNVYQYTNQENYRLPIFADAEGCDISIGTQIGHVEINVFSEDETPYATITYIMADTNYEFSEINLHLNTVPYPKDGQGNDTNLPEFYTFKSGALQGVTTYTFEQLNWPVNNHGQEVFMISNVKICAID